MPDAVLHVFNNMSMTCLKLFCVFSMSMSRSQQSPCMGGDDRTLVVQSYTRTSALLLCAPVPPYLHDATPPVRTLLLSLEQLKHGLCHYHVWKQLQP